MKIYLVGFYDYTDDTPDVQSICIATSSYEDARQYILDAIDKFKNRNNDMIFDTEVLEVESKYVWELKYKHANNDKTFSHVYRIEPIDLKETDNMSELRKPALEKQCEALTKHNDELKAEVAKLKMANSAAQCWLTFWDGGRYEDFDHILSNIHTARHVLRGDEKGNTYILKMFNDWKKHDDSCNDTKCNN